MARFEFFLPIRPWRVTQEWGVLRPEVYSQFGFTRHNGTDIAVWTGQSILAPLDYEVVRVGNQPNGGGIFVGVLSKNTYKFDDGIECKVLADFLHCDAIIVKEGETGRVGDLIAIGDNTGFSTGPHCHIQLRRVRDGLVNVDQNDANNSFDPTPYLSKYYAEDFNKILSAWEKILALASTIFKGRTTP